MSIIEEAPDYMEGTQIGIKVMNIRHYRAHQHSHALEFLYCFSGSAMVTVAHETVCIGAGELIAVEHENIHHISSHEDNMILSLHLDLTRLPYDWDEIKYLFFSCSTLLCKPHQRTALERICGILIGAVYLYGTSDQHHTNHYRQLAENLADIFMGNFCWFSVESLDLKGNAKFKERLNNIITYIQKHYREKITISQLAKQEYINENYLSQFLKRTSFHSFTLMVNYVRCFEAEKLLLNTNHSVQEISDDCGFSSKKYFHKYFKHYWKTTPLQHRKWHQRYSQVPNDVFYYSQTEVLSFIKTYMAEKWIDKLLRA